VIQRAQTLYLIFSILICVLTFIFFSEQLENKDFPVLDYKSRRTIITDIRLIFPLLRGLRIVRIVDLLIFPYQLTLQQAR